MNNQLWAGIRHALNSHMTVLKLKKIFLKAGDVKTQLRFLFYDERKTVAADLRLCWNIYKITWQSRMWLGIKSTCFVHGKPFVWFLALQHQKPHQKPKATPSYARDPNSVRLEAETMFLVTQILADCNRAWWHFYTFIHVISVKPATVLFSDNT